MSTETMQRLVDVAQEARDMLLKVDTSDALNWSDDFLILIEQIDLALADHAAAPAESHEDGIRAVLDKSIDVEQSRTRPYRQPASIDLDGLADAVRRALPPHSEAPAHAAAPAEPDYKALLREGRDLMTIHNQDEHEIILRIDAALAEADAREEGSG